MQQDRRRDNSCEGNLKVIKTFTRLDFRACTVYKISNHDVAGHKPLPPTPVYKN